MIYFLMLPGHENSLRSLLEEPEAPETAILYYQQAFTKDYLPRATYIFTNISLLNPNALIRAASLFRRLRENGCRVLNDPARALTRFSLLRALNRAGINSFNVYSIEEGEIPNRFPVFVRLASTRLPPLTDLIWNQETLQRALKAAVIAGFPRQALMVVEYAAEPVRPNIFRKLSVFRVGDQILPHPSGHDTFWMVNGRTGVATEELCDEELQMMRDNPFGDRLRVAFELAKIDYGRADFGLVGEQICIYEINMNPAVGFFASHPFSQRLESGKLWWQGFIAALRVLEQGGESSPQVAVQGRSIEALQEAIATFPGLRDAYLHLSREHARRGTVKAALQVAQTGVANAANNVALLQQLSNLLAKQACLDEAIIVANRIVEFDPFRPAPLMQLARLLHRAGRTEEALGAFSKAAMLEAGLRSSRGLLMTIHQKFGTPAAIKAAELILRLRAARGKFLSGRHTVSAVVKSLQDRLSLR